MKSRGGSFLPTADYDLTGLWNFRTAPTIGAPADPVATLRQTGAVNALTFGAVGDGVADDTAAILALRNAAVATGRAAVFPAGTYRYTTSPNWGVAGLQVEGRGPVLWQHTGTGPACLVDGGINGLSGVTLRNLTIQGNVNSTHGVQVTKVWRSIFDNLRVQGCAPTGSAFFGTFNVCNHFLNCKVLAAANMPAHGIYFADANCSANVITNPIVEGLTGSGLKFATGAAQTTVIGGTAESNAIGIDLAFNACRHVFVGIDLEGNATADVLCAGNYNSFVGVLAYSAGPLVHLTTGANFNVFTGGIYQSITIDAGAFGSVLLGVGFGFSVGGVFTDNGTNTQALGVWNVNSAIPATNRLQTTSLAGNVGFYGVTPIARALLATGAGRTVDDVITAIQNLGLVRQS